MGGAGKRFPSAAVTAGTSYHDLGAETTSIKKHDAEEKKLDKAELTLIKEIAGNRFLKPIA